eukprot:gene53973-72128_t
MPELPEVEAARLAASRALSGFRITNVNLLEQGGGPRTGLFDDIVCCESTTISHLESSLLGHRVKGVHRKGKQLWINDTTLQIIS